MAGTTWQDVRYAARLLRKSPGFTAVAVLSLALGIGANTAVFSLVDAAMFRALPVSEPERLVLANWASRDGLPGTSHNGWMVPTADGKRTTTSMSYPVFERFRDESATLADVFAFAELYRVNVGAGGRAELAGGTFVSGDYFPALGLVAPLGRLIEPEDDRPGAEAVAVVSHGYWRRRFGGDPGALGRPLRLNGQTFTLIGVAPRGFTGTMQLGSQPEIFVPLARAERLGGDSLTDPRSWWLQVMGRLAPGVTKERAEAELASIFRGAIDEEWSVSDGSGVEMPEFSLSPGGHGLQEVRGEVSGPLFIAWTVCGLVLLIACANLAGLLVARARSRRREIAVRLSVGASRGRLVRQLLTESLLLSGAGALLGMLLAAAGVEALFALLPWSPGQELVLEPGLNLRVLAFTAGVAAFTGVGFGLVPALRASGRRLAPAMKAVDDVQGPAGRARWSPGRLLLAGQVSLSLVLLVAAVLFARTLGNLRRIDPGFETGGVLTFRVDPTLNGYEGERLAGFYGELRRRVEALPNVEAATLSPFSLLAGRGSWTSLSPDDGVEREAERVHVHTVASNFLATMRVPLIAGRDLAERDQDPASRVAVINETFARRLFPSGGAVGRRFGFRGTQDIEIVGIARDAKNDRLTGEILPTVYLPYRQAPYLGSMTFSVRAAGDPRALVPAVRAVLRGLDADLPMFEVRTLDDRIDEAMLQQRQFARLAALFGLVALALCCIGIYGLLSHAVLRRTREFGIRQALGATRRSLTMLIMRELRLVLAGVALGAGLSLLATRWISNLLFGLEPGDPLSVGIAGALLLAVSALAAWIPARRAARVDPLVALRFE
jgi:predicted permease